MSSNETKGGAAVAAAEPERTRKEGRSRSATPARGGAAPAGRPRSGSPFHVYKPGQGAYVRWGTAAGSAVIVVAAAAFVREYLAWFAQWVQILVPVAVLIGLGYLTFWLLGQNRTVVDFMVATEGEMKKVNWSTRREVLGATKVVIVTVLALGIILFFVDVFFIWFFEAIGVLRIGILERLFGGGAT